MSEPKPITIIKPGAGNFLEGLRELWQYRDLIFFFALRDIVVRYKQTIVGFGWAFVQPLLSTTVFTVIFGYFAKLPSQNQPYALYAFCGVMPWMAFSAAVNGASMSGVSAGGILQKVYFPKLAGVFASAGVIFVDSAVQLVMLIIMLAIFGQWPPWSILLIPVFVLWATLAGIALGVWLAPINVKYRDVRYVLPFLLQVVMYASPVAYSSEIVPERWRWLYSSNPLVPIIDGFRWATLGIGHLSSVEIIYSILLVLITLGLGMLYFKRMEITFADEI
jgi:lipopolysaccharide transport system permease protein